MAVIGNIDESLFLKRFEIFTSLNFVAAYNFLKFNPRDQMEKTISIMGENKICEVCLFTNV